MDIGVPKEIKDREFRVGLTPASVRALCDRGHRIFIETQAGIGSGLDDRDYEAAGATIVTSAAEVWQCDLIVKVKEPLPEEYQHLRSDQIVFTYFHFAASRELTAAVMQSGTTAIAYETVRSHDGRLPLLAPMSAIAGRLSVQFGAHFLEKTQGGSGVLLGGVPGVRQGHVVVLGGGVVGTEAIRIAVGFGARVQVLDVNVDRLTHLERLFGSRIETRYSSAAAIEAAVPEADLLIGAVLVLGRRPPVLVSRGLVERMQPGSVIVDVAVDQGGCVETLRPTSHTAPTYVEAGVVHYGVPNMPGAVPYTATQALNNSTLPYVLRLADKGLAALDHDRALAEGLNIRAGQIVHPEVRAVFPDLAES